MPARIAAVRFAVGCLLIFAGAVACQPAPQQRLSVEEIPAPVILASPTTLSPVTAAPSPTAIAPTATTGPTATIVPTVTIAPTATLALPDRRPSPAALMLHESTPQFDAVAFLDEFIAILQAEGRPVVTYAQLAEQPELSAPSAGQVVIITIDDVSLEAEIDESILAMIDRLRAANYPAVLGVITKGKATNPNTVATLRELVGLGWELAAHTENHKNLLEVQQVSPGDVYWEIKTCQDKLEEAVGVRPVTLILPGGQMVESTRFLRKAQIRWAVGINEGVSYQASAELSYVGRQGPAGPAAQTWAVMRQRFWGE